MFKSELLSDTHACLNEDLQAHFKRLDDISSDIKTLEAVMTRTGYELPFRYKFASICLDQKVGYNGERYSCSSSHFISWNLYPATNKFRLLYENSNIESSTEDGSYDAVAIEEMEVKILKPLGESKLNIRLMLHLELPIFYKEFVSVLRTGSANSNIAVISPNHAENSVDRMDWLYEKAYPSESQS